LPEDEKSTSYLLADAAVWRLRRATGSTTSSSSLPRRAGQPGEGVRRPASAAGVQSLSSVAFRYLLFSDIACNYAAMGRFEDDWRVLLKVARGN
jgi:hypothetical protein